jgi:Ca2+-transporting ATPase
MLGYDASKATDREEWKHQHRDLQTLVFNTFVWMQIFNALNNRRLDNRFNVFEGVLKNWFFIAIFFIMIGGQVLIIFVGSWNIFQAVHQSPRNWGIALVLGALSIPIGVVVRLIPDELVAKFVPQFVKTWSAKRGKIQLDDEETRGDFHDALYDIRDELAWIKKYKGGRLNSLKFSLQHPKEAFMPSRSPSRSRASSSLPRTPTNEMVDDDRSGILPAPPTPESKKKRRGRSRSNSAYAVTAMAGVIAGSVAGGWSPIERREGDADSLRFARHRSKSDLSKELRQDVHPETKPDDPITVSAPTEAASGQPPSQSTVTMPDFGVGPFAGEPSKKDKNEGEQKDETSP